MDDIFISYSRRDKTFVQKFHQALVDNGRSVWVDWEGIPLTADWRAEIRSAIESADCFIFILSPDSIISEICHQELAHAEGFNKRIVPIVYRDVDPDNAPGTLASINWSFFRDSDDFNTALEALSEALDTDLKWVKIHTRLLVRALEWDNRKRNRSYLLRGDDLIEAEHNRTVHAETPPTLTRLQGEYIFTSREDALRRQRQRMIAISLGLVLATVLAILAFWQFRVAQDQRYIAEERRVEAEDARSTAELERDRAELAEQVAKTERDRAIRQNQISLAKSLASLAPPLVTRTGNTELGALLVVEAERLNTEAVGNARPLIDSAFRQILGESNFNAILGVYEAEVTAMAFSRVETETVSLAYGLADGTILLWPDINDYAAEPIAWQTDSGLTALAFSPTEPDRLVSAGDDGLILLWRLSDSAALPSQERVLEAHPGGVSAIAFSPDGRRLASSGRSSGSIRLWDLVTPAARPQEIGTQEILVTDLALSPDGQTLATVSNNPVTGPVVKLWDLTNLTAEPRELHGHTVTIRAVDFSPDAQWLASAGAEGFGGAEWVIRLWSMADLEADPQILRGHTGSIGDLVFSPDSQTLASASLDQTIRLWPIGPEAGQIEVLQGHTAEVQAIAYSPDGEFLASGSDDQSVRLWHTGAPSAAPLTLVDNMLVGNLAFSPVDPNLLAVLVDNTVQLWRVNPASQVGLLEGQAGELRSLAFSRDGQRLAAGDGDGAVWLWDVTEPAEASPQSLLSHESVVLSLAFSPDGHWLASGDLEGQINLWDLTAGVPEPQPLPSTHLEGISGLAFNPNGQSLASASFDGLVNLWSLDTLEPQPLPLENTLDVETLTFSPDGQYLLIGGGDNNVGLVWRWDLAEAEGVALRGHRGRVFSLAFSPNGQTLASASFDGTVQLWDIEAPMVSPTILSDHQDGVRSVSFSADGQWLATTGDDFSLKLWIAQTQTLADRACRQVRRNLTPLEWQQYLGDETYQLTCPNLPRPSATTPTPVAIPSVEPENK
ncbi:MAG: TIR domain-containing protein [Anaerolineae bacterium]|nr:TIR domain-containing protein [Anaerolineae bacterium]